MPRRNLEWDEADGHPPDVSVHGRVLLVGLMYPSVERNVNVINVNQCSVRASDGLRLKYDYERDGWSIMQASVFEWKSGDKEMDPDYQEVAFVQSWAREETR